MNLDSLPFIFDKEAMEKGHTLPLLSGSIIPFDKPLNWSSFDVVNLFRIRTKYNWGLRKMKVGHAGTLDPKATGLLLLCTGKATKNIEQLMNGEKEYVAELKLGATTPSYDTEQPEDATFPWEHITHDLFLNTLKTFEGDLLQVPPLYSATSIGGKRAYKLARKGKEVELPPKAISIHRLEVLNFAPPYVSLRVVCSRGTYIRSLARDLGKALGSGAYLSSLRRIRSGRFSVDRAFSIEGIDAILSHIGEEEKLLIEERLKEQNK